MAKCRICKEEIVLIPSAAARAKNYGETPSFYTDLFKTHSHCAVQERSQQSIKLMTSSAKSSEAWELPRKDWS